MGEISVTLRAWNPARAGTVEEFEAFVDPSVNFSFVSCARLQRLGVKVNRQMPIRTIEGQIAVRDLAIVYIAAEGRTALNNVVMSDAGEEEVLGCHSLDGLGFAVDPVLKRLVPAIMMALSVA